MANPKVPFNEMCGMVALGQEIRLIDAGHNGEFYALTFEIPVLNVELEIVAWEEYDVDVVDVYETFL